MVLPPCSEGEIILISRLTGVATGATASREASTHVVDNGNPKNQQDFLPADLHDSASASGDSASGMSDAQSNGEIAPDVAADTLRVTASSTTSASATAARTETGPGRHATGIASGNGMFLTFELTDHSYSYTLTGNVAATGNGLLDQNGNNGEASVFLTTQNGAVIVSIIADGGETKPVTSSGTLPPGRWKIQIGSGSQAVAGPNRDDPTSASSSAGVNCVFKLAPVGAPPPPPPQTHWINPVGGAFGTATNWNPEVVPDSTKNAVFDLAGNYVVVIGAATTDRLVLENGTVGFSNTNYTVASLEVANPSVSINGATLELLDGELRSSHAIIGPRVNSRVNVKAGATWKSQGRIDVAEDGEGTLVVAGGGRVVSAEAHLGNGSAAAFGFVGGSGAQWDTGSIVVGDAASATLNIFSGGFISSETGKIGLGVGAAGTVTAEGVLNDFPSSWVLSNNLLVGAGNGTGELEIKSGALVSAAGIVRIGAGLDGSGTVIVEGIDPASGQRSRFHGDSDLAVGFGSEGTLRIASGAIASFSGKAVLGSVASANVTVTGIDAATMNSSTLDIAGELQVGEAHDATVTIENGASLFTGVGHIGFAPGAVGRITVQGASSTWQTAGEMQIGGSLATGRLEIKSGASGFASAVTIGFGIGSAGTVEVSGVNGLDDEGSPVSSSLNTIALNVGSNGEGTLLIEDGGRGFSFDAASIGVNASGTIIVSGSDAITARKSGLAVLGTLTVGSADGVSGVLLLNGGEVSASTLIVESDGIVAGNGTLSVDAVHRIVNGGSIDPGLSPGRLVFQGNFEQRPSGMLRMQAAGLAAGQFDVLHVSGDVALGGTLEVTFLNGYLPKAGDAIPFLEVEGAVSGDFAQIRFPQLAPGFEIKTEIISGNYQLTALNDGIRLFAKGLSQGLLAGDPQDQQSTGFFSIRITARGAFSARFVLGGRNFTVRGKFDSSGKFSKVIPQKQGAPLTLTLELSYEDFGMITGTLSDGTRVINITADGASGFKAKTNPAPQAGQYTALMQFNPAVTDAPQANGIGVVTISKSGGVRLSAMLADGTRFSQGTVLSDSGAWPLYAQLYNKQGSVSGQLQFHDTVGADFDGSLRWLRPQMPNDAIQTAGFLANVPMVGARYSADRSRLPLLDLPHGATATFSDADPLPALTKLLMLSSRNRLVVLEPGADKLLLKPNLASGFLSGAFVDPKTNLPTKVHAVVFQKQNRASGFFIRPGVVGTFELQPNQ